MIDTEPKLNAVITLKPQWIEEIMCGYEGDDWAKEKLVATLINTNGLPNIFVINGLFKYKQRLYIGSLLDNKGHRMLKQLFY